MKSTVYKYMDQSKAFRIFVIKEDKNTIESDVIGLSSFASILLSQEERISFYFKDINNEKILTTDIYSNHNFTYKIYNDTKCDGLLFVTKSKLKNFGASYNSILEYQSLNLIDNFESYYRQSEQLEVSIFRIPNHLIMIQPLPFYNEDDYKTLKSLFYKHVESSLNSLIFTEKINVNFEETV